MVDLQGLFDDLSETRLAQLGTVHDNIREDYRSHRGFRIESWDDFDDLLGDYYNYHFSRGISRGGTLSRADAIGRAKRILEHEYRRHGGTIVTAFHDAQEGLNGGCRALLNLIAEGIKSEAIEHYVRQVFDHTLPPHDYDRQVTCIREFFHRYGHLLSPTIRTDRPEMYANSVNEVINSFLQAIKQTSSVFRRL